MSHSSTGSLKTFDFCENQKHLELERRIEELEGELATVTMQAQYRLGQEHRADRLETERNQWQESHQQLEAEIVSLRAEREELRRERNWLMDEVTAREAERDEARAYARRLYAWLEAHEMNIGSQEVEDLLADAPEWVTS